MSRTLPEGGAGPVRAEQREAKLSKGYHQPAMVQEVLTDLRPQAGGLYLDLTAGGGGHGAAILEASAPDGRLVAVDRDPDALAAAGARLAPYGERVRLVQARFDDLDAIREAANEERGFDGMLLDLGVSSHQLDTPGRGFSFSEGGPLDMRMGPDAEFRADELLEELDVDELTGVLRRGEVPQARRLALALSEHAEELQSTAALAALVERIVGRPRHRKAGRRHHPATLVFQALRIEVNAELEALDNVLARLPEPLVPGGRIVVLSYHSLEDRRVKARLRELSTGCTCPPKLPVCVCGKTPEGRLLRAGSLKPGEAEVSENPRARSARLRAWQRRR